MKPSDLETPIGLSGVFDNQATWCREWWRDGKVTQWVSAGFISTKGSPVKAPWGHFPDKPKTELAV